MPNIFLVSDTHFGHVGVTQFLAEDGSKMRPWDNVEEMDEALVSNWNSVVGPKDKVYHLGDVVINRKALKTLSRLNGEKVLVKGNHDIFPLKEYTPYFKDVRGSHKLDTYVLTHIPVHSDSLARWCGGNIHGHLHERRVMKSRWYRDEEGEWNTVNDVLDERYFSVCVEQIDYTPISFEELRVKFNKQKEK